MNKNDLTKLTKRVTTSISRRSPEILTGIGIAGMVTASVLAVKATPKAIRLLEEAKKEKNESFTKMEVVKTTWKLYIPVAVTTTVSIACLIGASSVNFRRNAALTAAYKLSETALTEYKDKVVETIGKEKEKVIREKVTEDKIKKQPVNNNEVIITKKGNTLCFDSISGRYFRSDMDIIKKAENELNRRMLSDMYISLNEFYDELGLDHIRIGDELGWNIDDGLIKLEFSSHLASDGTPCVAVEYEIVPNYGYSKFL
jgi:hypothetical protein